MSKKQIKNILEDIYKIDKSLKAYGPKLEKIVIEILEAKPEISIDKEFKQELYREIMARISELKPEKTIWNFGKLFKSWQIYAFSTVAVVVILIVVVFPVEEKVSFNLGINDINDSGFGEIVFPDSASPEAKGIGGTGTGGGGMPSADGSISMPAPGYTEYKYVYTGDDFSVDENTAWVYKRKVDSSASQAFAKKIFNLKFDLIDFSKFKNLSVENIAISENRSFGYSLNLNFKDASFGVYKNWQKWPRGETVKISDIPSDEKIIAIADAFIKEHNIDMSSYGDGKISESWRVMLERAKANKQSEQIVNQEIAIMYQLFLDNIGVYDEWGNEVGIWAEVNVVNKKLSNLSNVTAQSYDRSKYALETNVDRILESTNTRSIWGPVPRQEPAKIIEVQLGTPKNVFVQALIFKDDKSEHETLYVPALSFPVVDSKESELPYGRKRIMVPLVKEVLDQRMNNNRGFPEPVGGQ